MPKQRCRCAAVVTTHSQLTPWPQDITNSPDERWEGLFGAGRLAFAPVTEMTEEFMKKSVDKVVHPQLVRFVHV